MKSLEKVASVMSCLTIMLHLGCSPTTPPPAPPVTAEPAPPAQKAMGGVGQRGQSLQNTSGVGRMIAAPAATLFHVEQKAVLEIQIPKAVQLFQATEGRFPKSHEEFMQKIVEANKLVLPKLPPGQVYHFDSDKGELWVYPEDEVPK